MANDPASGYAYRQGSLKCGRCGLEFLSKRRVDRYCSERCQAQALEEWARDLNHEEREFWRSLATLTEPILFFLDVDIALGALQRGDRREVDRFFRRHLGRESTLPHELKALFCILTRSNTWRNAKWPATPRYLGRAAWLEGQRIRDEWERDGIRTPERFERDGRAARELDRRRTRILRPDRALERKEAGKLRALLLERVHDRIRRQGTDRDRAILQLRRRHLSPAEVVSHLGVKWSAWQAYLSKFKRWMAHEAKILQSEMSSRRVSAA